MRVMAGTIFRDYICSKMLQEWEQQGCHQCEINPSASPASLSCIKVDVTKQPKAGQVPPQTTCIQGLGAAEATLSSTLVSPLCRSQCFPRQDRDVIMGSHNVLFSALLSWALSLQRWRYLSLTVESVSLCLSKGTAKGVCVPLLCRAER